MAATGFLTADELNALLPGTLPGLLGMVVDSHEPGRLTAHLDVRPDVLAPNGYLHAATVVALRTVPHEARLERWLEKQPGVTSTWVSAGPKPEASDWATGRCDRRSATPCACEPGGDSLSVG